ncbi:MAG: ribonuclease HI family protein [Nanoarchaeota archaeon]
MIQIYTDGGSRGNPGHAACAFLFVKDNQIVKEYSKYIGIRTNNEAEYHAIILALENVEEKDIEIISDSELVIKQINGQYKIKQPHLQQLRDKISILIKDKNIVFKNVKRENPLIKRADGLVNKKLNMMDVKINKI